MVGVVDWNCPTVGEGQVCNMTLRLTHGLGLALTFAIISWSLPASAADCSKMVGEWKNQLGSTLDIQSVDASTGKVDGRYMTATGAGGWFPLVGWVNEKPAGIGGHHVDKVIAFTVRWDAIGSITAWTGYCEMKGTVPTITTLWHLVRPNSDYEWDHVLTNSDVFTPK